jgi:hypothetical protein
MLVHIVMIKISASSETEKKERISLLKDSLDRLPSLIPEIKYYDVGVNTSTRSNAYDMAVVSEFENADDLSIYRDHPEHQKVVRLLDGIKEDVVVVDYKK